MVNPHHLAHWYPTAAYLYVFWLDALALAWEYLRRHPDYRLDWLRRHGRPEAAHRWGLRLLEDPMLDARDAHPAWHLHQKSGSTAKPYDFACDLRALVARQSLPGYVLGIERMPDNGMELLTFRPVPHTARG